jgi:acylpyruvate hydrolase
MKLVTYDQGGPARAGLSVDIFVADLEKAARAARVGKLPASVRELLALDEEAMSKLGRVAEYVESVVLKYDGIFERRPAWLLFEDETHLGPPVPDPGKIVCVGLNYKDHCREQEGKFGRSVEPPPDPVLFAKFPSALTGPYDPIPLPAVKITAQVDFEAELAVVIGRTAKGVNQKEAAACVAGYMVLNDVSARDCQFADKQWVRGKSFDGFAPCGPCLVTAGEIPNPHRLAIQSVLNGAPMQVSNTREMIFSVPRIVSYISQAITLNPGDIIATGTPAGVGIFREPPVLMRPGDTIECSIQGLGTICNTCERA